MNVQELFETVDRLQDEYIDRWEEICNIESPTNHKAGIDAVGQSLIRFAKAKGWEVEVCPQKVAGDAICITLNGNASAAPICLSGHIDTVFPVGSFGSPAVRKDGEKIYGPGVTDCKGGVIAALLAMDALERCGFQKRPIRLLVQTDEETGSMTSGKATIGYICEKAAGAEAFLNLEGAKEGSAVLWRKGILRCRFTVHGKAGHSSACHEAANAIAEAAHKIILLEKLKDKDNLTCNCGVIEGGTVANTVPDTCIFLADIRYKDDEQLAEAWRYLREVAEQTHVEGCSCTLEEVSSRPAMVHAERNLALLDRMNEIFRQNGLSALTPRRVAGGSDAAYITQSGIPCVDNLGPTGGKIHSVEEFANLRSLCDSAKRIAVVTAEI